MRKNVINNITLDRKEKVYKTFKRLSGKGSEYQILLTSKRLVIYSKGPVMSKGKKTIQKRMNEIDLKSVHRLEYYIEYIKNSIWVRLIGFILLVSSFAAGYYFYWGLIPIPAGIPYASYTKYAACGLVALIALFMMFNIKKTLYLIIESLNSKTSLKFDVNRYNEVAIRYIASKIRSN